MKLTMILTVCFAVISSATGLSREFAVREIPSRESFELLSDTCNPPGSMSMLEVKFLITDIHSDSPQIYFMNTKNYPYHYDFYREVLNEPVTLFEFNRRTYYRSGREIIAGSLVSHQENSGSFFYTIEFWPVDLLNFQDIYLTHSLISSSMFCSSGDIIYHPVGQSQANICNEESELYITSGISVISTDSLYKGVRYIPFNTGEALGVLREPGYSGILSAMDIPVFISAPNTIGHVAGLITTTPQTPLSHVNLLAKQNGIPSACITNLFEDSVINALFNTKVRFSVRPDGYSLVEVSEEEFSTYYSSIRPSSVIYPSRDLALTGIPDLSMIGWLNWISVGAKAANVAELARCLPNSSPSGLAVPFFYYDQFFTVNGLYDSVRVMIDEPDFVDDPLFRRKALAEFRNLVELSPFPDWMLDSLGRIQSRFPEGISLRCRSSTNAEDLPGFNGAGLYRSYTHHPYEGHISLTIRKVWAGLWTYRAFEEREFHRIDHFSTAMGVLIHESYRNELANGVAVTMNIFDSSTPGFYVNAQIGENLVTNPHGYSTPDEFIILTKSPLGEDICEPLYISFSNLAETDETVLTEAQVHLLADYLQSIHDHFSICFNSWGDPEFAMEVEFKITEEGELVIKQARPWIN